MRRVLADARSAAALAGCLLLAACSLLAAQEQENLAVAYEAGKAAFEDFDFETCVERMSVVIDAVRSKLEGGEELDEADAAYYPLALEYRALTRFTLAEEDSAREDFRTLLGYHPDFELAEELASPLAREFFENIRTELVGYLRIRSQPSGATVAVDGTEVGQTNLEGVMLLAGQHTASVMLRGYGTQERQFEITAGQTADVSVALERTHAVVFLHTSPAGAEILLDGELVGVSEGVAGDDYRERAVSAGLTLDQISAEFTIPYVSVGAHAIEVRKDCHVSRRAQLSIETADDYNLLEPLVLTPSLGNLELLSVPEGSRILIDGEEQERGKTLFEDLCSGPYRVEVLHSAGSFIANAMIVHNRTTEVEVSIRPALVYVGEVFGELQDSEDQGLARRQMRQLMERLSAFQLLGPDDEGVRSAMSGGSLSASDFSALSGAALGGQQAVSQELHRTVRSVLRELGASLLAVAAFKERRLGLQFRVVVLGAQSPFFDVLTINVDDAERQQRELARLNYEFELERSWLGLTAVDTRIHSGAVVLAVQEGGPAAQAGVRVGSTLQSIDGTAIRGNRDLAAQLATKEPGEAIAVTFESGGETRTQEVTLGTSARLLPLASHEFCYNAAISAMALEAAMSPGTAREQIALLNTGLALAHFGGWEDAITYLRRVELGSEPGVNQGTVEYYLGLCYENLGYRAEALSHYSRSYENTTATLESNDGPLLAPRVGRKVAALADAP